jgi:glycosyltransferase involved in cell wall biosynthesis
MSEPLVTIGVCVKNAERAIDKTISSVLNQNYPPDHMEIVFVDDGSEDKTLQRINLRTAESQIDTNVMHTEWKGLGAARQTVVDNARGKYIVWVDAGLTLSRSYVRKQVEFMDENPKAGIAKGIYGVSYEQNFVATLEDIGDYVHFWCDVGDIDSSGKETIRLPGTGGSIYRVTAVKEVGGFDKGFRGAGEDTDIACRIKAAGWSIFVTDAIFYKERKETWPGLWRHYFWYGRGLYYVFSKHGHAGIFSPHKMVPLAGFVEGLLYSRVAYKLTYRKIVFLLPLQFAFKRAATCLGLQSAAVYNKSD